MKPEELKSIISELDLTKRELAGKLCVNIRTMRRWLSGECVPNGTAVLALRGLRIINELGYEFNNISNLLGYPY